MTKPKSKSRAALALLPDTAPVRIHNVCVAEKIGRISIDGLVAGSPAAVVFMESEVPASVVTPSDMQEYMIERLRGAA